MNGMDTCYLGCMSWTLGANRDLATDQDDDECDSTL